MGKKKRVVLLLGAGFPLSWGAPTSNELKSLVYNCCERNGMPKSFLNVVKDLGFEEILASLYALYYQSVDKVQKEVLSSKYPDDSATEPAGCIFCDCINYIMKRVSEYENNCSADKYARINSNLLVFFECLESSFNHVSVYTTNYDDMLFRLLGWKEGTMSRKGENCIYNPLSFHRKKKSYSNLHGSIHLERRKKGMFGHEIVYTPCRSLLGIMHVIDGGNPGGPDLFSPIIAGHHKTQMIMSEHFNYPFTCFANDLSDADVILTIGYSFSDPHVNAMIQQYSSGRNFRAVIVDKKSGESLSDEAQNDYRIKIGDIFHFKKNYAPDCNNSAYYVYKHDDIVIYKNGVENFLSDTSFCEKYLFSF